MAKLTQRMRIIQSIRVWLIVFVVLCFVVMCYVLFIKNSTNTTDTIDEPYEAGVEVEVGDENLPEPEPAQTQPESTPEPHQQPEQSVDVAQPISKPIPKPSPSPTPTPVPDPIPTPEPTDIFSGYGSESLPPLIEP